MGWESLVYLWNAETAELILSNNFLLEKSSQYDFLHPWLGTGLLTSTGSKWRNRRKLLGQAFHYQVLQNFFDIFNKQSNILVEKLQQICNANNDNDAIIDVVSIVAPCTLDVICGKF